MTLGGNHDPEEGLMRYLLTTRALRAFAMVAAVSLMATACDDDDPAGPDDEPATTRIVLTIGTGTGAQTVTWNTQNTTVTPATITIPAGQSRTVTAQFFRADNTPDPVITEAGFRLDFNVASGTAVTIAKTSNLAATLTATGTAGQSISLTMELFHLGEGHEEYVSNTVTVTVQ